MRYPNRQIHREESRIEVTKGWRAGKWKVFVQDAKKFLETNTSDGSIAL